MHSLPQVGGFTRHAQFLFERLRQRVLARPLGLDSYTSTLIKLGLDRTTHLLTPSERESLALVFFIDGQLETIRASNYSAPALMLSNLLENAIRHRILSRVQLVGRLAAENQQTLATLSHCATGAAKPIKEGESPARADYRENWRRLERYASRHWSDDVIPFEDFARSLYRTAELRNRAVHYSVNAAQYSTLYIRICGDGQQRMGALAQLAAAWRR